MSASIWAPGAVIDASDVVKVQRFTATFNQTVFTLTSFAYAIGNNSLNIYIDGVFQGVGVDFTETSSSSFTLAEGVPAGTIVTAVGQVALESGGQYADEAAASAAAALASQNAASASASAASGSAGAASSSAAAAVVAQNAATAAAVNVIDWDWVGPWITATAYKVNNSVSGPAGTYDGWSFICLVDHTSGTFTTDYGAGKWGILAKRGSAGAGTGDMLGANNLSDVVSAASARTNLGATSTGTAVFTAADAAAGRSAISAAASGAVTSSGLTQSTAKILGRSTAGTGAIEEITVGSGLTLSGGSLAASSGSGGQLQTVLFTSNTTWTCPAGVTKVRATVLGGGAGGETGKGGASGGPGGYAFGIYTVVPSTGYSITIGAGGLGGSSGGSSAFSSFASASGGGYPNISGTGSGGNIVNGAANSQTGLLGGSGYANGSGTTGTQGAILLEYIG